MNRRYEHDPQPGELPEELKPRQKLDPVSEAIVSKRMELKAVLDDDYRGLRRTSNTNKSRMEILALFDEVATLSYARGVEDSARVVDGYRGTGSYDLRSVVASIRSLTPHKDTV